MQHTVQSLKDMGFDVDVTHYRRNNYSGKLIRKASAIDSKGGMTVVKITKNERSVSKEANCSMQDNYNKKLGVCIAFNRAYKVFWKVGI